MRRTIIFGDAWSTKVTRYCAGIVQDTIVLGVRWLKKG